jgi:hypothetical protein
MAEPSTSHTYYQVTDVTTESTWDTTVSNIGTWGDNSFQTMSESSSALTTVGYTNYENSFIEVGPPGCISCTEYNVGGSGTYPPLFYGGVCSSSSYSLGTWSNSVYGYSQPAFTIEGSCIRSVADSNICIQGDSHNLVSNPGGIIGAPDYSYTELYAGNPGDCAWVSGSLGQKQTPSSSYSIRAEAYSYSGYESYLFAFISTDGSTWTQIGDVKITSTGLAWIQIGTTSSSVLYIKLEAEFYNGYSSRVGIDSVAITW